MHTLGSSQGQLSAQWSKILKKIHAQCFRMLQRNIRVICEQSLERVDTLQRQGNVSLSVVVVLVQKGRHVHTGATGLGDCFHQDLDVTETQVQPLPRHRMDCMGGISNQCDSTLGV